MSYQPLDAGRLDKRVTIQSRTEADDDGGGQTWTQTNVATVWASISPGSGREFVAAQQIQPEITHEVRIRYRADVTAKHRIAYGSRVFSIVAPPIDPMERHEQLVLYCSEIVGT